MNRLIKKEWLLIIPAVFAIAFLAAIEPHVETIVIQSSEENRATRNEGREDYFFNLMRDPATNSIPVNVRKNEVAAAKQLPTSNDFAFKGSAVTYDFTEVGPNNVGGRTRALAVDVNNSNIILAGGVSGGVWKSTDGGQSWTQRTTPDQTPQVSFIAQDPRSGFTSTWYYVTGERSGNSASDRGFKSTYFGNGMYRSTDNGDTWQQIAGTSGDQTTFDSCFDFGSKVVVSPTTGSVFVATAVCGVFRSSDGTTWTDFSPVLGSVNDHAFSDVVVASNGTLYAVLSSTGFNGTSTTFSPGVYESTNDGISWVDVTPTQMPAFHDRSRVTVAPSNPDLVYVFIEGDGSDPELVVIDRNNSTNNASLTANIPDYVGSGPGEMNLQGGYNMTVGVDPSNSSNIIIGGTNLFASTDGFTSSPAQENGWIGGYGPDSFLYPNHHPDNHVLFFDPNNAGRLYSGHDGGISVTQDAFSGNVSWTSLNNGYNVTQFYTVAISPQANDDRIVGGTQDNGSPYFRFDTNQGTSSSYDVSSGDGSYAALRTSQAFVSSQRGSVLRLSYQNPVTGVKDNTGDLYSPFGGAPFQSFWSVVQPSGAADQLFIHPYLVDYLFENVMFYPSGDELFRNISLNTIPDFNGSATETGWALIPGFTVNDTPTDDRDITALDISRANPQGTLYVAGSDRNFINAFTGTPVIKKIASATISDASVDVSIPNLPAGAYIHDIHVNPVDGNEVLVVVSNYNVESVYHTTDGGNTWTGVEGNLGTAIGGLEGPSVRAAVIAEIDESNTIYFVGTSAGLFSTQQLDGNNTTWVRESPDEIALNIVERLDYRPGDNVLAVGTHGRGIFIGQLQGGVSNEEEDIADVPESFGLNQNYPNPFNPSTNIQFNLPQNSLVTLSVFDINGRKVAELIQNESYASGTHTVGFDATNLASGVYIYNIRAIAAGGINFTQSRTMTLIK